MNEGEYLNKSSALISPYATTLRDASLQFEEKVRELSLLRRVGDIVKYFFDLEVFYRKFTDLIIEETNAENCSFMLLELETNRLVLKIARGRNDDGSFFDKPIIGQTSFSLGEGIAGKAALTGESILLNDVSTDDRFQTRATRFPIGSILCIPLVFRDQVLGIINMSHSRPNAFNQNTKRVIELLCSFISALIYSAIDYMKIQDEEKFRAMFEGIRLPIMLIDPQTGKIIDCNKNTEHWLDYTKDDLTSMDNVFILFPAEYSKKTKKLITWIGKENNSYLDILPFVKKDGSTNIGEVSGTLINYQGRKVIHLTIKDITENKKAMEALEKSERRYLNLIEHAHDAIISINKEGKIIAFNKKAEQMYGYSCSEIIGKDVLLLAPPELREKQKEALERLKTTKNLSTMGKTIEAKGYRKNGTVFPVETSIFGLSIDEEYIYTSFIRDITDRKKIEDKLVQSEKLKSLGELAGGIAHEFNNVLSAILGRTQLLQANLKRSETAGVREKFLHNLKNGLEIIEKASVDGAETVRRIQEFSRKGDDRRYCTEVDINSIIDDAIEFTRVKWKNEAESKGKKINIKKSLSPLEPIAGNASELREVFTNLINNACDAMPDGGEITISTFTQNANIVILCKDTGTGIPEIIRNKIFDPFFTTKGPQATGLGMSVSYGIISRHRGTIKAESIEGKGSTFTIMLPLSHGIEKKQQTTPAIKKTKNARILVIEDEEAVRMLLSDILTDGGYEVDTASDGYEGIEKFKGASFDLVFTDLGMPGMSGWKVAEEIKKITSKTPVALITGWEVSLSKEEMEKSGVDLIVNKPFRVNQILRLVQDSMDMREKNTKNQ